jgi:hypothetical protein
MEHQCELLLGQLAAVQAARASAPALAAAEASACGAREAAAEERRAHARVSARARVDALLHSVPAPLLALAGQRASAQLTPDQRLALETHLLALEEAEHARAVTVLEAEVDALQAREASARSALLAIPSEMARMRQEAAVLQVRGRERECLQQRAAELLLMRPPFLCAHQRLSTPRLLSPSPHIHSRTHAPAHPSLLPPVLSASSPLMSWRCLQPGP